MQFEFTADGVFLARSQFAITSVYHFFFVPLTLGLSVLVALMQTRWALTGNVKYKRLAQFWGKLFLVNFALGVVTGLVQEFQFGLNWSNYSRFVGDVFGAPLAIEALLAFFLESTFLGVWIFGWDRLSKPVHTASIWIVAFAANLSALWILIANSFMQNPVGYEVRNGRAEMTDFFALITNPHVLLSFPHVFFAGVATGSFFALGVAAWHLWRNDKDRELHLTAFRMTAVTALVSSLLIVPVGHAQAQRLVTDQPMKMAAAEALWQTENPASFSLFSWFDENERKDIVSIRVSPLLSLMTYNSLEGEVKGINDLQAEYEEKYGPGDYVPPVFINYWSFRIMVGMGFAMIGMAGLAVLAAVTRRVRRYPQFLALLVPFILAPYLANTTGWFLAEFGRQPWVVTGLMTTSEGISPTVSTGMIAFSLVGFTMLYGVLMLVDVYLLARFAKEGPDEDTPAQVLRQPATSMPASELY